MQNEPGRYIVENDKSEFANTSRYGGSARKRKHVAPSIIGIVDDDDSVCVLDAYYIALQVLDIMVFCTVIFKARNAGFVIEIIDRFFRIIRKIRLYFRNDSCSVEEIIFPIRRTIGLLGSYSRRVISIGQNRAVGKGLRNEFSAVPRHTRCVMPLCRIAYCIIGYRNAVIGR